MERNGNRYFYHFDGSGSVVALTGTNGIVSERYTYGPYGESTNTSTVGNPYRYTGRELDAETGLYYYRARYYSHPARCPSRLLDQVTTISNQATLSVRRWRHGPVKFHGQRPPFTVSMPTDAVRIHPHDPRYPRFRRTAQLSFLYAAVLEVTRIEVVGRELRFGRGLSAEDGERTDV